MTEIDIYIELFKKLGFKQIEEITTPNSNILICEGRVIGSEQENYVFDNKLRDCIIKIWFNHKTEIVSSILCESKYLDDVGILYTKPKFDSIYRDLIREIKLKEYK